MQIFFRFFCAEKAEMQLKSGLMLLLFLMSGVARLTSVCRTMFGHVMKNNLILNGEQDNE